MTSTPTNTPETVERLRVDIAALQAFSDAHQPRPGLPTRSGCFTVEPGLLDALDRVLAALSAPSPADGEREAIVRYLNEEADDCIALDAVHGSAELAMLAVQRATYYRQAAKFISKGEHLRKDRPRPTQIIAPEPASGEAQRALYSIYNVLHCIYDKCEDEGDRIYLGSTNDHHTLKRQLRRLEKLIPEEVLYPDIEGLAALAPKPDEVTVPYGLGHKIRSSDASSFDEICDNCGATDRAGSNALSKPCPKPSPNEPAIPAGMKPWHGGDSAPEDWDGGRVMGRDHQLYDGYSAQSIGWQKPAWVIAYTPKPSPDRVAEGERLKYYPDYIDDPDGLERMRRDVRENAGHDIAKINYNSLGRLIDTIERLRRERDTALATPDARLREENGALRGLLANLEKACDNLAATRSRETYLSMVDRDHATPQLLALDDARRDARAALGGETKA